VPAGPLTRIGDTLTFMAVHAHPDDESSSTGGVLALYGREGIRTVVVTCTNGELGDGPGHVKPDEEGHDEHTVAAVRLAELDKACDILGVSSLERLGYHDSGMPEWRHHHRDDVFCNVPIDVAADRLIALFEQYQPDVVATYADNGGYNHPDHLHAHHITVAAAERSRIPAKLYYIARRRRDFQRLRDAMRAQGLEPPNQPPPDPERMARITEQMEALEKRITTSIDVGPVVDLKRAALMAHASQLDESWFSKMPPELYIEFFQEEAFIRAADTTGAPVPEDDLFAGLRVRSDGRRGSSTPEPR
jgi:LmbE family N-acetylglucosaminyl deacetylase